MTSRVVFLFLFIHFPSMRTTKETFPSIYDAKASTYTGGMYGPMVQ